MRAVYLFNKKIKFISTEFVRPNLYWVVGSIVNKNIRLVYPIKTRYKMELVQKTIFMRLLRQVVANSRKILDGD